MKRSIPNEVPARPTLNLGVAAENFIEFYWLKKELIAFCRKQKLWMSGSKSELTERIYYFLKTGKEEIYVKKCPSHVSDSFYTLTLNTPVVNYKNDRKTSEFFKIHIGKNFHFNDYLRKFKKEKPADKLTYGDLVNGWLEEESRKKNPDYKTSIAKQFQYNQFIRDFFKNEKNKTQQEAINAWNLIKSKPGPCTYESYRKPQTADFSLEIK